MISLCNVLCKCGQTVAKGRPAISDVSPHLESQVCQFDPTYLLSYLLPSLVALSVLSFSASGCRMALVLAFMHLYSILIAIVFVHFFNIIVLTWY